MVRKGYKTITVKEELFFALMRKAKERKMSIPELIGELLKYEEIKLGVHKGGLPQPRLCYYKVIHLSEPGRNYCSLYADYKTDEECAKCNIAR